MMYGTVSASREPIVRLRVRGPKGLVTVPFVIDTGYDGVLTLPSRVITTLGLAGRHGGVVTLADGSVRQYGIYTAELEWHDGWRTVQVSGFSDASLLGMEMLDGHSLRVECNPGGAVEITPSP
jgi:clan AA aspartic protease